MASKKRINWLLILQGWAMLWVVIGHSFNGNYANYDIWPIWESWLMMVAYSFHMPLFILVSGWLFYRTRLIYRGGQWSYSKIVRDKTIRILLPGLVFSIIAFATKMALPGEVNRQVSFDLGKVLRSYLYPYDNPFRELWFSVALFWMFLLMPIWQFVLKRRWAMWGMVTILFVLHFFHPETQLLAIDKTCLHGIWFFTGLVLSKEEVVEKVFERQPCVIMLAGSVVYAVGIIVSFSLLKTIGGITFSFGIALIADRYLPKLFFTFRNYTYQIFLMGIFAQMLVKILSHHFSLHYVEAYILCVLFGLYVPVLASKIIEKINWKPLKLCCGLK